MQQQNSAVDFPTRMRAHIALACHDVERSRAFYEELLGLAPTKVRPGYVKFEVLEPPLNLSLNHSESPTRPAIPAHFGVQVKSTQEVLERRSSMAAAGFAARSEEGVGCCYAVQDKVWFVDPDNNQWEVFVVTEADIPVHSIPETRKTEPSADDGDSAPCCAPSCCS